MENMKQKWSYGRNIAALLKTGRFLPVFGLFIIMMLYGLSAAALNTGAEQKKLDEYKVKAAYLYNFAKFVTWPEDTFKDPSLPLGICIFGDDPFGDAIDVIKDKNVKGKKLEIKQSSGKSELMGCHILFISPSENKNLSGILKNIKNKHMLTVSDMNKFAHRGGMINLKQVKDKIRLEINHEAAKQSGLKVSSKLLKIAKVIKGNK